MKKVVLMIGVVALLFSCGEESTAQVGDVTEEFTVYGNCGMCEKTIESSLDGIKGVSSADWNKDNDQMTVSFNADEISLDDIKQKIADVGYDSDSHRAKDEVYNKLHGCCQYDRPE